MKSLRVTLSFVLVCASLFTSAIIVTVVSMLHSLEEMPEGVTAALLYEGRFHGMLLSGQFWQTFPSVPAEFTSIIDVPSAICSGYLIMCAYYYISMLKKWHIVVISLACALIAALLHLIGLWALEGNADPAYCGRWLRFMLIGTLYCLLATAFFALLEIVNIATADAKKYMAPQKSDWRDIDHSHVRTS